MFRFGTVSLVLMMAFMAVPGAFATEIKLVSGQEISGKVIEKTGTHVVVDDGGVYQTYYLGEIATIDGEPVDIPQAALAKKPAGVVKEAAEVPKPLPLPGPAVALAPAVLVSPPQAKVAPPQPSPARRTMDSLGPEKNVIPTPDGGVIVVGSQKLSKYDEDLNLKKEVDLKTQAAPG